MHRREVIVHDDVQGCPYLPGERACMPLRLQLERLDGDETDASLAMGDRRVGPMLYRTACPTCVACEPIRIPVDEYRPTRSVRRVARRNRDVRIEVGPIGTSEDRLALFNRHRLERGLSSTGLPMSQDEYVGWFVRTCLDTVEMRYLVGERLVGVGILDVGRRDTSSVYFYFDPDEGSRSLGTLSVLAETEWLRRRGGRYHYLGLFVAGCRHLSYKARYFPHERRVDGGWRRFEAG